MQAYLFRFVCFINTAGPWLATWYRWNRVLLVTSAFHMPRAMMLFESQGIGADAVPADYMSGGCTPGTNALLRCLIPDAAALHGTQTALREAMGYGFYWLRARLF